MAGRAEDLRMLQEVAALERLTEWEKEFVESCQEQLDSDERKTLTDKQREVLFKRLDIPKYLNLVTDGKVPRGREVPTCEALLPHNLPKRPPGRR
jgi:hypothetical protein